jgi:hypothetical protein
MGKGLRIIIILCIISLAYSYQLLADWDIQTIDSSSGSGWGTSLAIDQDNNIHIAYYDNTAKSLKYAYWNDSSWSIETIALIASSIGLGGPSIAIDSNSLPHIIYIDFSDWSIKYAYRNGLSWSIESVASGDSMSNMAIDANNNLHIVYRSSSPTNLVYAKRSGTTWDTETVAASSALLNVSLALDTNNYPHIAYGNGSLNYAFWTGAAWSLQSVDSTGGDNSIVIDTSNYPHIAYYDTGALEVDLKYAYWNGTQWTTETVDSAGDVGADNSIAIDANNNIYISYRDYYTNADLKFAQWNDSTWSLQTVDSQGTVGSFTSLKLDKNGRPCITYLGNSTLKFARWASNTPSFSWTGETNYTSDGLDLEVGTSATTFTYRVKYTDIDNDPPKDGYPKVHIKKGNVEITGSPFGMSAIDDNDTTYSDGKIYTYATTLSAGDDYSYYFEAYDYWNSAATGTPITEISAPDVTLPSTYYIKGRIKESSGGQGIYQTVVNLSGQTDSSATTDINGYYEFLGLSAGTYKLTPYKTKCSFSPESISIAALAGNSDNNDFTVYFVASGEARVIGSTAGKGTINPAKGETAKIEFKGTGTGKFSCKIFNLSGDILWEQEQDNISEGTFEWVPGNIASGIYVVYIKGPGLKLHKKVAILK